MRKLKFYSDNIDIVEILLDCSKSMRDKETEVIKGLEKYKKSFEDFPEANSIAVAISRFNDEFYPGEFKKVREMDIYYRTAGATALYYSICKSAKHLMDYVAEVTEETGCKPKVTYVVFSDGEPYEDRMSKDSAKKTISNLNYAGVTTVFVAFGKAITSGFGDGLGFQSTEDINSEDAVAFFAEKLSKASQRQSQVYNPLGANFFSQAANSQGYSQTAAAVLEDDSWIDEI